MSDPRQEDRERGEGWRPSHLPTRVLERIRLGLSPCDDDLPFAQALRAKEEMDKASAAYAKRMRPKK